MATPGIQRRAEALLEATNLLGGYPSSLVCTDQGLVVASAGERSDDDDMAAFTSLFDDIVVRARRDLGFSAVDEVTLVDSGGLRTVIRPLELNGTSRLFVVVQVPAKVTWRRHTNVLCKQLAELLADLVGAPRPGAAEGGA